MVESGSISVTGHGTRARNRARIVLDIDIPENCHIEAHEPAEPFLIPTVIEVDDLHEVEIVYPRPRRKEIIPGAELLVYDDRIQVEVRGRLPERAHTIAGRIRYQPCVGGGACLPPRTDIWSAPLQ
jgi:hypothetical protein